MTGRVREAAGNGLSGTRAADLTSPYTRTAGVVA